MSDVLHIHLGGHDGTEDFPTALPALWPVGELNTDEAFRCMWMDEIGVVHGSWVGRVDGIEAAVAVLADVLGSDQLSLVYH